MSCITDLLGSYGADRLTLVQVSDKGGNDSTEWRGREMKGGEEKDEQTHRGRNREGGKEGRRGRERERGMKGGKGGREQGKGVEEVTSLSS